MSKQKKNGKQNHTTNVLLLTAVLNLIRAVIELINRLIE